LTGLSNRRHLDEVLDMLWRRARRDQFPIAALMIDVDHFKHYNDHFGHLGGDECLRTVAAALARFAGRADDLAVRYGGEEFLLILSGTDLVSAEQIARRVLEAVHGLALPMPDPAQHITVSIGVASLVPGPEGDFDILLQRADAALYQAKQRGRNQVMTDSAVILLAGNGSGSLR
jgi:diguanylate cyclase (GGDEF)-like protein